MRSAINVAMSILLLALYAGLFVLVSAMASESWPVL